MQIEISRGRDQQIEPSYCADGLTDTTVVYERNLWRILTTLCTEMLKLRESFGWKRLCRVIFHFYTFLELVSKRARGSRNLWSSRGSRKSRTVHRTTSSTVHL